MSHGYKKFFFLGDLVDIPDVGLFTSVVEVRANRERIRRTVAAVLEAVAWQKSQSKRSREDDCYPVQDQPERSGTILRHHDRDFLTRWRDEHEESPRLFESSARRATDSRRSRSGEAGGFLYAIISPLTERQVVMKFRRLTVFLTIVLTLSLTAPSLRAAADQLEGLVREQTKARQEEKIKALKQQEQLENLKRDQQASQAQQQLDQIRRQQTDSPAGQKPQAGQTQQQLDQLRNDQQLQRLQTDQQINRIQRETDPLRQQQQINDLQRQQQIRSLQEQLQRNQTQQDLDRLRQQPQKLR